MHHQQQQHQKTRKDILFGVHSNALPVIDAAGPLLTFQALAWTAVDEKPTTFSSSHEDEDDDDHRNTSDDDSDDDYDNDDDTEEDKNNKENKNFCIYTFGVKKDGTSVSLCITGYEPHFFVKVGESWTSAKTSALESHLKFTAPKNLNIRKIERVTRRDFYGFRDGRGEAFLRISFKSLDGMHKTANLLRKGGRWRGYVFQDLNLYESNVEPMLRFMHERDLQPVGWLSIPRAALRAQPISTGTTCGESYTTDWRTVSPVPNTHDSAPAVVMSFDIECNSSHGDFPAAKKGYTRLANELQAVLQKVKVPTVAQVSSCIQYALGVEQAIADPSSTAWEAVISRMHLKDPSAVLALVQNNRFPKIAERVIAAYKNAQASKLVKTTSKTVKGGEDGQTTVRASVLSVLDDELPALCGDEIIQVGATLALVGHPIPDSASGGDMRHIFTLGTCTQVPGAQVHAFRGEKELLLAWASFVRETDPDIMLGYNIMGFDFAYMYDRAEELDIAPQFCRLLSRRVRVPAQFKILSMHSAAMGDNEMKYIDMPGRVIVDLLKAVQRGHQLESYKLDAVAFHFMKERKDDVSPQDIFRLQRGSDTDRAIIAKYCVQDCELVMRLCWKLDTLANNSGMANVCSVPLIYIFTRGQGIKVFSLVTKQCRREGFVVPALARPPDGMQAEDTGYEGAIVLDPTPGIYMEPVTVLDYASLYPSSMISENLSHDSIVLDPSYDNLPGVEYVTVEYADEGAPSGRRVCRFAQGRDGTKAVIPRILQDLIAQRKATRRMIEHKKFTLVDGRTLTGSSSSSANDGTVVYQINDTEGVVHRVPAGDVANIEDAYNDFEKAVLDGLQLAYKTTANSLYGAIGARTSQIYLKQIAACTTATGRRLILEAKDFVTQRGARVVYGDTDSIFCIFPNPSNLTGEAQLAMSIAAGEEVSRDFRKKLKPPHNLEYDKTLYPLVLLSKKRYVGNLYEHDVTRPVERKSMGIVLKRRDNANIVKIVYGGIIDCILNDRDVGKSVRFLWSTLDDLRDGKFPIQDFVVTKSLQAHYEDPDRIAHRVLADRMGRRDQGNKPRPGDRIEYVYFINPRARLQGDKIENPKFALSQGLKLDYRHYIENQIMKPVCQIYGMVLEQLPGFDKVKGEWETKKKNILGKTATDKLEAKLAQQREALVVTLLFKRYLDGLYAASIGQNTISKYFLPG